MNEAEIVDEIERILVEIAEAKAVDAPQVTPETALLGGAVPIDSLDLAGIVVQLESATGYDPFSGGFIEFRTVGELAKLYAK